MTTAKLGAVKQSPCGRNESKRMKLKIVIEMDNAAFADAGAHIESARILRAAASRIEAGDLGEEEGMDGYFPLKDLNGNTVGKVEAS